MIDLVTRRSAEIPAPASDVWELLADFAGLADWWPSGVLERVDVEGAGIGMVRAIHTHIGIVLSERLDALDDDELRIETSMTGDLPVGMCEYTATGQVVARGVDACRVEWRGCYRAPDRTAGEAASEFVEGVYAMMFKGLRERFTARRGHGASPAEENECPD